jgi:hypothetical protein
VLSPLADTPLEEGGNAGFLRPGARLVVVVVGDEDDCSELPPRPPTVRIGTELSRAYCTEQSAQLTPVPVYAALLQSLQDGRGAPREVVFAAIAPVARSDKRAEQVIDNGVVRNVDCPTSFQAGERLREMAQWFDPGLTNLESICKASFRDSLLRIAELAALRQSVEVMNTSDGRLLQIAITREDGSTQLCTQDNGGILFQPREGDRPARAFFQGQCLRRVTDQDLTVRLLCVG